MDEILKKLGDLESRIGQIEARLGISRAEPPKTSINEPAPLPPQYRSDVGVQTAPSLSLTQKVPSENKNIESYIGRWVLGVVGLVAVIFGASFFLKYAFDSNLIGPAGRVALGIFGGLVFIVLGEVIRSRYVKYSYILSAGGLSLFYLSIYGAFHFYSLIGQTGAFGFMIAVTAFGIALAIWASGIELALLAALGGFLTPFLLSSGTPNDAGFFFYIGILNIGILAVAFFKKWHPLTLLGFTGTVLNFASWYGGYYDSDKLAFTLFVLTAFYIIYVLVGVVVNIATRKISDSGDLFILTINAAWYFWWCYHLLYPTYTTYLGFLAAGLGALYILFAYFASVAHAEDKKLVLFLGAIAVVFLTIAIPLELEQNAITIAWAIEAAILYTLGVFLKNKGMRVFALGVLVIAGARLLSYDTGPGDLSQFTAILNKRFFTYLMVVLPAAFMGYLAFINRDLTEKNEKIIPSVLVSAVNFLIIFIITLEIATFYSAKIFELNRAQEREARARVPVAVTGGTFNSTSASDPFSSQDPAFTQSYQNRDAEFRSITNQRNAFISVFWTLYAVLLITLGFLLQIGQFRWMALLLFGVTVIKVFLYDLAALRTPYRIISFTVLGVILLIASFLYFRYQKRIEGEKVVT